jgi:phosphoglycolate phosphatase
MVRDGRDRTAARACFFDLDGTLIDSRADLAATVNETRRAAGLPPLEMDEVLVHVGHGAKHLLSHAIAERPDAAETLWDVFQKNYAAHMNREVTLYPGVRRTLTELAARGWKLGVNTSKPAFATQAILARFGLTDLFAGAVVAGGDCPAFKPSALPLEMCAARLGGHRLSARDWMVGDSDADMLCAANAGVNGAFCSFGFGRLGAAPCTVRIDSFEELLTHLA